MTRRRDKRAVSARGAALATALVIAPALCGFAGAARAADDVATQAELKRLTERLEQLEQRNRALEEAQARTEKALATDRLSETEPELVTRLKAVEYQTLSMQKQARQIEALEGITVGASLTGMVQSVGAQGSASGTGESRANYRGDVSITLPGGEMGNSEGKLFTHIRFGQGNGIALRPTYTGTPNTTAFQVSGVSDPDSSFAILAQAWYQLDVPLPFGGYKPHSHERLEFNVGKMDPFVFFDQNAAADDETTRFANNIFVHSPLLDSGGDVGVDAYGFTPGVRLAYRNEQDKALAWGASAAVFGSGPAANFSGSLGQPFMIGQLEASTRLFGGLPGTYRWYGWRNGRATDFDGTQAAHTGWGLSVDQRVPDSITLFGRFGQQASGHTRFDRALTLGAEVMGDGWRRAADALGFAVGFLRTSAAYRDATADTRLVGYAATGSERIAELYYRYRFNNRVELTPDLQWIEQPGGDAQAAAAKVIGLRAKVGF